MMVDLSVIVCVVLVAFIGGNSAATAQTSALKCYVCDDCAQPFRPDNALLLTCPDDEEADSPPPMSIQTVPPPPPPLPLSTAPPTAAAASTTAATTTSTSALPTTTAATQESSSVPTAPASSTSSPFSVAASEAPAAIGVADGGNATHEAVAIEPSDANPTIPSFVPVRPTRPTRPTIVVVPQPNATEPTLQVSSINTTSTAVQPTNATELAVVVISSGPAPNATDAAIVGLQNLTIANVTAPVEVAANETVIRVPRSVRDGLLQTHQCYMIKHTDVVSGALKVRRGCVRTTDDRRAMCSQAGSGARLKDCKICGRDGCNGAGALGGSLLAVLMAVASLCWLR